MGLGVAWDLNMTCDDNKADVPHHSVPSLFTISPFNRSTWYVFNSISFDSRQCHWFSALFAQALYSVPRGQCLQRDTSIWIIARSVVMVRPLRTS